MPSILEYYKANNLNYSATSSTPLRETHGPYSAFNKEGNHFQTQQDPSYWQISFTQPVAIGSYIISGESVNKNTMTSWNISYSIDGENFTFLQTDTSDNLKENKERFPLKKRIYCKHFKITGRTTTFGKSYLFFYCFDCFSDGSLRELFRNSCDVAYIKRRVILSELVVLMTLCISK